MKRKNEKGNESSRLLLPFTHVFVRTPAAPSTVTFRKPGTVPIAVRKISPRSSGRTERAAEIESITSEAAVRLFLRRFIWARHSSVLQTRKETSYFSCGSRYFSRLFLTVLFFLFAVSEVGSNTRCTAWNRLVTRLRSMAHLPVEERERLELDRTKVIWVSIPA